ncbi:hypothetical protein Tco_1292691 [Tanacetum coccineum]
MTGTKFDIKKLDGKNDFGLWQVLWEITKETIAAGIGKFKDCIHDKDTLKLEDVLTTLRDGNGGIVLDGAQNHMNIQERLLCLIYEEKMEGGNILLGDGKECRVRETEGFTVKMQSGRIKVIRGSMVVLSRTRRANCVYTLDGQESTQQCMKSGVAKHLSVAGIQQHNELAEDTNMTFLAKVCYFLIQFDLSKVFWAKDTTMSIYLVNRSLSSAIRFKTLIDMLEFLGWLTCIKQGMLKIFMGCREGIVGNKLWRLDDVTSKVMLYRNMSFNKSGEYKKTFIDSGVGKAVTTVKAITGSIHQAEIWDIKGLLDEAKDNILGMEVVRDQSGNTLRVSQSRVYNGKSVQTLLEGHSILSLEVSLSGDCDVEKNGKWSYTYAVGSQVYQAVCTRPDIASTDVGMLDGFDRGLQTNIQFFVDFDYAMGRSITVGRSIIGYGFMIRGCAGEAKLQHMEALSTTEAGYMTLTGNNEGGYSAKGTLNRVRG